VRWGEVEEFVLAKYDIACGFFIQTVVSIEAPLTAAWFCALTRLPFKLNPFASTIRIGKRIPMPAACGSLKIDVDV
jgi:hypothetical protein